MNTTNTMRILLAQINCTVGDIDGNLQKIIACVKEAESLKADLIVFPELAITGYPPEDLLLRPAFYQAVEKALKKLLAHSHQCAILIGYPHRENQLTYNAAVFLSAGKILHCYKKRYLPNYHVFDEKRYFQAGDKPCVVSFKGFKLGLLICEDIWQPSPAAESKAAGADCLIVLNASPFHLHKHEVRKSNLIMQSHENHCPIFYLNLVGGQDELIFDGHSLVVDQTGHLIYELPFCAEALQCFDVSKLKNQTLKILPQMSVTAITRADEAFLYEALTLSIRDYVRKNGFQDVVVGLSGGVDSALTLALAVDALGKEHVTAVMMPSRFTSTASLEDAASLANALGVDYQVISIEPIFQAFLLALAPGIEGQMKELVIQNLQARVRGVILMAISNQTGKLVLTTGNKSELAVGYCTLYGDMAGGFCVLKDLVKTRVYSLARYRNTLSAVIPERIFTRAPTAELAHNQTDQDSLPPYEILDAILMAYVEDNLSESEIIQQGFEKSVVQQVIRLITQNEYKRFQAPPGPRLTSRAFGKDWRYPLTNRFIPFTNRF